MNASRRSSSSLLPVLGGAAALAALAAGLTALWVSQRQAAAPIRVEAKLDNRCELADEAFMAVVEPGGEKAYFRNGVAVLTAPGNARIRVRSSDRFPEFDFQGPAEDAAEQVVLTVRCGDRVERVIESMREQFKRP